MTESSIAQLPPRKEAASIFGPQVRHWTDAQITEYLKQGALPKKTKRGNWCVSVLRKADMRGWDQSELLDWIDGEIEIPDVLEEEEVWQEIYNRWKIPGQWTYEDAKAYITDRTVPEEIVPGVLKNDRSREFKLIGHLKYKEITLCIEGKLELKYTKQELLDELKRRAGVRTDWPDDRILNAIDVMEKEMSDVNALLINKLEEYKKLRLNGGRKPSDVTEGEAQTMFWNSLCQVLDRKDYRLFQEGFTIILDFIDREYTNLFTINLAARNLGKASLNVDAKSTFAELLNMMVQTRSPIRRKQNAKIFNINTIMRKQRSDIRRQNLLQYYGFNDE